MVATRKRAAAAAEQAAEEAAPKRSKVGTDSRRRKSAGSPAASSPPAELPFGSTAKPGGARVLKKGSRGAAYLSAAGIALSSPPASPAVALKPPTLSSKKESAAKAARLAEVQAAAPASLLRSAGARRNPLMRQALPSKLTALLDMFAGLQTVYEVARKRGQRTTYQNLRAAVEEASGRRFLLTHVAQLQRLLPEAVQLEWVRLPVAAHSSRTEAHLLIALDTAAAAEAAVSEGAAAPGGAGGELQAARHLLHCRLAGHLLGSYREHLEGRAAQLRAVGDEAAAGDVAAAAAAAEPPVENFLLPYPEGVADVPQQALPPRPDAPTPTSRGGSPAVLAGTAAAAAAVTPFTSAAKPAGTAGRTGRPPLHPGTVDRARQRKLSFGTSFDAAVATAAGRTPRTAAVAGKGSSPLDKLDAVVERQAAEEQAQHMAGKQAEQPSSDAEQAVVLAQLNTRQRGLAAVLSPADLQFGSSLPSPEEEAAERAAERAAEEARLLASMPRELRRYSTDGIVSFDTLKMLEAAEQQHRRLSSKEAQAAREAAAVLGELPRTFSRLQRIFGLQGPNALKLRDVVLRIKQGGAETTSEAQVEAALRALAEHAPEYVALRPYGRCGTPALWVDRRANANAVMAKLRRVAEERHAARDSLGSALSGGGSLLTGAA
ncbi:hypothetical protein ABPG75_006035 [Micractinium tetrahymenae]